MSSARKYTERQLRRREDILKSARDMIAHRGYDGVNMRDLAVESGVAIKTLYMQFGSKENLLCIAVEEKFRDIYQAINEVVVDTGIDRLFYIVEAIGKSVQENAAYARALAPFLSVQSRHSSFAHIRVSTFGRALRQIAEEGELTDWTDVELLNSIIYRQIGSVFQGWSHGEIPEAIWIDQAKLEICLTLASVTTGKTNSHIVLTARQLQLKLKSICVLPLELQRGID